MRRLAILWTLLGAAALMCGCTSDLRKVMDEAEELWRGGNYEGAVRLNRLVYEQEPRGRYAGQALLNMGNIYYRNIRRLDQAIECYNTLTGELPNRPEALEARLALADIYANEIGDLTQAIHEYDRILESEKAKNRNEILFERANVYFRLEDFHRSLRELRRLEDSGISGHLADRVSLKIGTVYLILKRLEDAAARFDSVIQSPCPECRRSAIVSLMETYEHMHQFERAIETIQKLDPSPENDERVAREVSRLMDKQRRIQSGELRVVPRDAPKR